MVTITGLTSGIPYQSSGEGLTTGMVWSTMVSFSAYRIDDGPLVHESIAVRRVFDEAEEMHAQSSRDRGLVPSEEVVRVEAARNVDGWPWRLIDIIGVVSDDAGLDQLVEALSETSEPVYPSDEFVDRDGRVELIPDVKRVPPFELAGAGLMVPQFGRGRRGHFSFWHFQSQPMLLRAFNGLEVQLELELAPSEAEAELIGSALTRLLDAGPELQSSAAPKAMEYYSAVRGGYSDEECKHYGISLDITEANIWDHIELHDRLVIHTDGRVGVPVSSAEVILEGTCSWDEEHGIQITLRNGDEVHSVGSR